MTLIATRQSVYDRAKHHVAETPFVALDMGRVVDAYHNLRESVPGSEIFYAVKANSHESVLSALAAHGSSYDVASLNELEKVIALGVTPDRIICSNPIKNEKLLRRCAELGVYAVVTDSVEEVEKVARYAPGMRVYVRLAVDNSGAVFPLDKKFGSSHEQAIEQLLLAKQLGCEPIGLAFHVGSQCVNPHNWVMAIEACGNIWKELAAQGINLYFLDLGGGYPVQTDPTVPSFNAIGEAIQDAIAEFIPNTPNLRTIMEPGRAMTGDNGVLVLSVVGKAQRGDKTWLFLDSGLFNGMAEIIEGYSYPILTDDEHAPRTHTYTLAGPSCDSFDTIGRDIQLPEIKIGDRLYFLYAGAYTVDYGSHFNGFPPPTIEPLE
jgi:ornithine decarboxylase